MRESDDGDQLQGGPFPTRYHSHGRELVCGVSLKLSACRRIDGGAWGPDRPCDYPALGREIQADPAKSEAECATSETHRWGALDVPSAPDGCAGRAAADWENIVRHRWCPSSPAKNLRWG